jgi:hypothetical protein
MNHPALHGLLAVTVALCAAAPAGASTFRRALLLAELEQASEASRWVEPAGMALQASRARSLVTRFGHPCPSGATSGVDAYTEAGASGPTLVLLLSRCDGRISDVVSLPLATLQWVEVD